MAFCSAPHLYRDEEQPARTYSARFPVEVRASPYAGECVSIGGVISATT